MKINRLKQYIAATLLFMSSLTPFVAFIPKASAAALTWDGEGADNNWSTATNWSTDAVPVDGDSVIFDRTILTQNETLNNDLTGLSLAGINVSGTSTYDYTLDGNSITLTGDYVVGGSDYEFSETGMDLTVGLDGIRIQKLMSTGSLTLGSNGVVLETAYFDGSVSGTGDINFDIPSSSGGAGGGCSEGAITAQYPFKGDNSGFSGAISLTGYSGLSVAALASSVGNNASSITVGPNAILSYQLGNGQNYTFPADLTLNGGRLTTFQYFATDCNEPSSVTTVTLSGDVTATADVEVSMFNASINMTGTVNGADYLKIPDGDSSKVSLTIGSTVKKAATKTTTITGDSSSTTPGIGDNNIYVVNEGATLGNTTVAGGVLKGKGTVGTITMSNGSVAPGMSPGCLTSGNLTYTGGSVEIEIAGKTACTEYDQQVVNGTVTLGTATALNVSFLNSFVPAVNDTFVVVNNDGSDAVSGTFSGLAEGATFQVNGVTFSVSYTGGDGNDVTLTVTGAPAAPDTGLGQLLSNPYATLSFAAVVAALLAGFKVYDFRKSHN